MQRLIPGLVLVFWLLGPTPPVQAETTTTSYEYPALAAVAQPFEAIPARPVPSYGLVNSEQVTPTVSSPQPTRRSPSGDIPRNLFAEATNAITVTIPVTATPSTRVATPTLAATATLTPVVTSAPTATLPPTATLAPTPTATPTPTVPSGPIEGTIIANRTEVVVSFFVEGQTYELAPLRSQGIDLPRSTAVLNLFNCAVGTPETDEDCFWDPYLLNRDGFYEILPNEDDANNIIFQPAGTPPADRIWVQNRIGSTELIFFEETEYQVVPSGVQEFTGEADLPLTLYVRSCLESGNQTVCEWYPQSVEPGIYYALTEMSTSGSVPGSRRYMVQLEPVVGALTATQPITETEETAAPAASTPSSTTVATTQPGVATVPMVCTVLVPALNVRSGPGLEYEILTKVRGTESEPGDILVVGRDLTGQWLAVDNRVAAGGWITGSASFVECQGDTAALPETEIADGRLAATPTTAVAEPVVEAAEPETPGEGEVAEVPADETPTTTATTPITSTIPDGQALLIINNGFDQVVRFTLDQRFRVTEGPSEYDLQPGQSVSIFVIPGQIAFSASSPWRSLSGNDDFFIDNQQARDLWIFFVPDPDGSGDWLLQY